MTDRFPLILDSGDNRIKELPSGDNLDLEGSQIVNAVAISAGSISTTGTIQASSITVNGSSLATVALTNSYTDLDNLPAGFSGSYNDLTDKPNIPSTSRDLDDVVNQEPTNGDALLYNSTDGLYEPGAVLTELDLSNSNIGDLNNVLITGTVTNKYLKFSAGAWRPSFIQYSEVKDKPTNVSFFANDAGYITADAIQEIQGDFQGSVFADDSTLLVDGVEGKIVGDVDTSLIENTSGNLNINASNYVVIDSTDNGQIEIGRASGIGNVIIGNTNNGTDVNITGRLFLEGNGAPASSVGSDGDFEGIFAVDNDYIYYCTATFDGVSNIWKRVAWSGDTW